MNLDVLIPSLFLPAPVDLPNTFVPSPAAPALERMLARADHFVDATPALVPWLCERWGVAAPYPIAPLLAEYDGLDASSDGWIFAEPVQLVPQRDGVKVLPARSLELSAIETAGLIALLNSHFADSKLKFFAPTTDRWYVRCPPSEIPNTVSPDITRIGSVAAIQPKSAGILNWSSLQNEAQMLFFSHPVNAARESNGKPAISGVWFWGGGVLPELKNSPYSRVIATSPLAVQLARKSGIEVAPPIWASVQSAHGKVLAVVESCDDFADSANFSAAGHELERLDREWFLPISQAISNGAMHSLNIFVPGNGGTRSYHITRRNQLLRFWRTTRSIATYA